MSDSNHLVLFYIFGCLKLCNPPPLYQGSFHQDHYRCHHQKNICQRQCYFPILIPLIQFQQACHLDIHMSLEKVNLKVRFLICSPYQVMERLVGLTLDNDTITIFLLPYQRFLMTQQCLFLLVSLESRFSEGTSQVILCSLLNNWVNLYFLNSLVSLI